MQKTTNVSTFSLLLILVSLNYSVVHATTPSHASKVSPRSSININTSSQFVAIDQKEPAFTVFTGIPKNIGSDEFKKIKQKVSSRETLIMLTWDKFLDSVDKYAQSVILINDYPDIRIVDGLVCLVASKQGTGAPWGLTWNGGIALTYNDYQHARRTYESYKANPASYIPLNDPGRDPVNPAGHLPFGGCN
ncbi:MAG: hypothetical protein OEW99_04085 [Gammaproteobacteria bacterium]|nr:hypothetical protein [Gammaproteobacteria bacterium]